MRATVPSESGGLRVEDVQVPDPDEDEVLVETSRSGICPTGVDAVRAGDTWGFDRPVGYPGHEFSGRVVGTGASVDEFAPGDRVVADLQIRCGECHYCRHGRDNLCENISMTGYFSHAEYVLAPSSQTVHVPDRLSDDAAALAEPVACVLHSVSRVDIRPEHDVLVVGSGQMGLLHQQAVSALTEANVVVTDVRTDRLERAARLGADATVLSDGNLEERLREYAPRGPDVAFVTVGDPTVQKRTIDALSKGGSAVLYAGIHGDSEPTVQVASNRVHYEEVTVTGSSMRTLADFERAVDFLADGGVDVDGLLTHRFALGEISEALDVIDDQAGIKAMLDMSE